MDVNSGEWTGKMAGLGAGVGKDISYVSPISWNDKNKQLTIIKPSQPGINRNR